MIISSVSMTGKRASWIAILLLVFLLGFNAFRLAIAQETRNLSVTATVPANSGNFPVTLTQNTSGTRFPQNTQLSYTITYGSTLQANVDLTLTAQWSRGTIQGDVTPTLDIIDYVPGSASNAYNSTSPVIDTVNRKITWTITNFPASTTTEQVTFKLTTNSSYTGSSVVDFTVSAYSSGASATSATSSVSKEYQYDVSLEPTATPTPTAEPTAVGPSATPGPAATKTPTPTPTGAPLPSELPFRFTDISLQTISPNSATIFAGTTQNSTAVLSYGTATNALSDTVIDLSFLKGRILKLSGLKESTRYYFRITAKNASGTEIRSDLYTFVTGRRGEAPIVDRGRTILTADHIVLYPSSRGVFVIPITQSYELNLVFTNPGSLRKVVLNNQGGELKEIQPGKYTARLTSSFRTGTYPLSVRVSDTSGNITDVSLGTLRVIERMAIKARASGKPIEHARVKLSFWNYRTGKFEFVSPQILPISNPLYSNNQGIVRLVLPQGRYKVDVTTILNKPASVEFVIGPGRDENFPVIQLDAEPFAIIPFIRYQWETCLDALESFKLTFAGFADSLRLFELNAYILLLLFILLTYLSLSRRLKIPLRSLKSHLGYRLKGRYLSQTGKKITGIVRDAASEAPISGADVFLIDPRFNTVLSRATSRSNGGFSFPVYDAHRYVIEVMKDGYKPNRFHEDALEESVSGYILNVNKHVTPTGSATMIADSLLSLGLEFLLILSFIFEVVFSYVFGLLQTAPFIALSLFNLALIVLHNIRATQDRE